MKHKIAAALTALSLLIPTYKEYADKVDYPPFVESELANYVKPHSVEMGEPLTPKEMLYLKYDSATIDSVVHRYRHKEERFIDTILDTVSSYNSTLTKCLIKASVLQESGFYMLAISSSDASGFMQFTKPAWEDYGKGSYEDVFNPFKNINAGIRLNESIQEALESEDPAWDTLDTDTRRKRIVAGYNAGKNALKYRNFDFNKMPKESKNHAYWIVEEFQKKIEVDDEIMTAYFFTDSDSLSCAVLGDQITMAIDTIPRGNLPPRHMSKAEFKKTYREMRRYNLLSDSLEDIKKRDVWKRNIIPYKTQKFNPKKIYTKEKLSGRIK